MTREGGRRRAIEVVGGQVIGQLSLVLIVPVLTRVYAPEAFGGYQLAMAVAMTAQPLATLRSEFVIPSVARETYARQLFRRASWSVVICVCTALAVSVVIGISAGSGPLRVGLMIAVLLTALTWTVLDNARLVRAHAERRLAVRNAIAGLATSILQVTAAVMGADVIVLAFALLAGRAIAILATKRSADDGDETAEENPRIERPYGTQRIVKAVASGVAATATGQSLTIMSGAAFGRDASAYVGVAQRVAGAPIGLLGQGLSQAFQTRSSRLIRSSLPGLGKLVRTQTLVLGAVSGFTSIMIILLAPPLAVPVLGPGWEQAGIITAVLALPISFQLLVGPLMPVLPMLGREGLLMIVQLARLLLALAGIGGAMALGIDLTGTAVVYGVAVMVGYAALVFVLLKEVRIHDRRASGDAS